MDYKDLFKHVYIDNGRNKTLFLLHGTGGDEENLLPLVQGLSLQYNFLGLRGNVVENDMNRFFARTSPGVFDQKSIKTETDKLAMFFTGWGDDHENECELSAFVGYSNGANMIAALAFMYPKNVEKAVLLHGLLPIEMTGKVDLAGKDFFVSYGKNDVMISPNETLVLVETLKTNGGKVQVFNHDGGHEINHDEVDALEEFLR